MADEIDDIPRIALAWLNEGRKIALASVIETWGSAPRRIGAQLVIDQDGMMMGSVSGGCVEGAVIFAAQDAIHSGKSEILEFGVADDNAFAVGLACGGNIRILVQPVGEGLVYSKDDLTKIVKAQDQRVSIVSVTDLETFSHHIGDPKNDTERAAARLDRSQIADEKFIKIYNPPLRLFVIGAVHIAQPLVIMAQLNNFEPTVIDPRGSFAAAPRFPSVELIEAYPDEVLRERGIDHRTAIVALTHDPKIDDKALALAIKSDAFYVGALGSKRTHAKRVERMLASGFSEAEIERICAPVGLDIGAATPSEIATSISAQIVENLRKE